MVRRLAAPLQNLDVAPFLRRQLAEQFLQHRRGNQA